MKIRICPNCGFKNFTDNPRCSGCSELLMPAAGSRPAPPAPIPGAKTATPTVFTGTRAGPPVPIPKPTSSAPVPFSPASSPIPVPFPTTVPTVYAPNPLPAHLLKQPPPIVEGEVEDTGQHQNEDKGLKAGDVLHGAITGMLLITKPLYGLMSLGSGARKPKEFKSIFTFRVRTPRNEIVEARIEKDILGASISLGDYVSIWGKISGGVVIVHHAYNHTVRGEVRLR
jgi:hypothetical protein